MRKVIAAITIAVGLLAVGTRAGAQSPAVAERDRIVLSAERLFGFIHTEQTVTSAAGVDTTTSADNFSLFANPFGTVSGYGFPRVGLDFVVGSHATVGGSVAYFHIASGSSTVNGVLLAPRAGYLATLAPRVQFWPRGGFTLQRRSGDTLTASSSSTFYAVTIEAPVAILLPPRVAILAGPALDLGLGGSASVGGTNIDTKITDVAFHVGLGVFY